MSTKPYTIEDMIQMFPGTTRGSWAQMRYRGTGPEFFHIGKKVFYTPEAVEKYVQAQTRTITGSAA